MKRNVLDREKKFPERLCHVGILPPRRQQKVNRQNDKVRRHDPQDAASEEAPKLDRLFARERGEQLSADQVTAEDEKKIDADPAEAINAAGQFESEKRRVINDDDDDGERTEKIETRLTFAMLKARVDYRLGYGLVNGANVAGDSSSSSSASYLAETLSILHEMQKSHDIAVVTLAEWNRSFAISYLRGCN